MDSCGTSGAALGRSNIPKKSGRIRQNGLKRFVFRSEAEPPERLKGLNRTTRTIVADGL